MPHALLYDWPLEVIWLKGTRVYICVRQKREEQQNLDTISKPVDDIAAVALAFVELRTPYASEWEICVQKFGNAHQRKEKGKRMTHFKSTSCTGFIKRFSEVKCCSQAMRAFLSKYSSVIRPRPIFLRTPCASLPWFCVQLDFHA